MRLLKSSIKFSLLFFVVILSNLPGTEVEWLPHGSFFPTRFLDPTACQQGISVLSYKVDDHQKELMYVPVSLSMQQQLLRTGNGDEARYELGMEFSVFSQFSVVDAGEAFMGGLQNADYRVSAVAHIQGDENTHYRISLFHQSSHLGDDYIIRNSITTPTLRTLNYEQVDLILSKNVSGYRLYGGGGYNVSPNTIRDRIMLQGGIDHSILLNAYPGISIISGFDLKVYEHNDYTPNLRVGFGTEITGNSQATYKILLSWYRGRLPYSTLEYQKVSLLGLSLIIDLHKE